MMACPEVYMRMTKKPMATNQVMPEPTSRPRTPKDVPLETWVLVPVLGLAG